MTRRLLIVSVALCLVGQCGLAPLGAAAPAPGGSVLVLAAASTTNVIDEIRQDFNKATGNDVRASYAASSTLAQQIVHGADADIFLSADQKWANFLGEKGVIAQRRDLLANRLVVIVPQDSPLKLAKLEDLATAPVEHLALGDPAAVPAGRYAKQAFTKLGVWEQLQGKVAVAEDVRHALTYVETGAVEAGIVFSTDAAISKKVRVAVEVPLDLTEPIRYRVALLTHGRGRPAAEAFYQHLQSPAAAAIFKKYGFTVLEPGK